MHRVMRNVLRIGLVCAAVLGVFAVAVPAAEAHTHPTPADLTGPGVVYIESGYRVHIGVTEHDMAKSYITLVHYDYTVVLARGSGLVVDPSAVVVTSARTVTTARAAAVNYAINRTFEQTSRSSPYPGDPNYVLANGVLPKNPYGQRTFPAGIGTGEDFTALARLKACYDNKSNSAGGCDIVATPFVTVYPYVTNQRTYGQLDARVLKQTNPNIALLRVSAGSMPTVDLEDVKPATYDLGVLGFDAPPNALPGVRHGGLEDYKAHLNKPGDPRFKAPVGDNADFKQVTPAVLTGGLQGGPVVDSNSQGTVVGMIAETPQGSPTLISSRTIRAALAAVSVTRADGAGPADFPYQQAEHSFTNKAYAAAIPDFKQALAAYPGNFLASRHLATARKLVGSPVSPATSSPPSPVGGGSGAAGQHSGRFPWWGWLMIAVAVALATAVAVWLALSRRRGKPAPGDRPAGSAAVSTATPGSGTNSPRNGSPRGFTPTGPGAPARTSSAKRGQSALAVGSRGEPADPARDSGARPMDPPRADQALSFCTNCGGRLTAHHHFCGWCGAPVE